MLFKKKSACAYCSSSEICHVEASMKCVRSALKEAVEVTQELCCVLSESRKWLVEKRSACYTSQGEELYIAMNSL